MSVEHKVEHVQNALWTPSQSPPSSYDSMSTPLVSAIHSLWIRPNNRPNTGRGKQAREKQASAQNAHQREGGLAVDNGKLVVTKCSHCRRENQGVWEFAPHPVKLRREFVQFEGAVDVMDEAEIERLRAVKCYACRFADRQYRLSSTTNTRAKCRAATDNMRTEMARVGCSLCEEDDVRMLLALRPKGAAKEDEKGKPLPGLLNYNQWSDRYGKNAPEMIREQVSTMRVVCMCCKMLEDEETGIRGSKRTRKPDSEMDARQLRARGVRDHSRYERGEYDKAAKRARGGCAFGNCNRRCTEGQEAAFHWLRKDVDLRNLDDGHTVGALVNTNHTLATVQPFMDTEHARCHLYCANHKLTEHTSAIYNTEPFEDEMWTVRRKEGVRCPELPSTERERLLMQWIEEKACSSPPPPSDSEESILDD